MDDDEKKIWTRKIKKESSYVNQTAINDSLTAMNQSAISACLKC